jgi:hypothetical protein
MAPDAAQLRTGHPARIPHYRPPAALRRCACGRLAPLCLRAACAAVPSGGVRRCARELALY